MYPSPLECGGKRSATPLWMSFFIHAIQSAVDVSLCRRTPNLSPAPRASNIFNDAYLWFRFAGYAEGV
jgi:hypothetical protein